MCLIVGGIFVRIDFLTKIGETVQTIKGDS